MSNPLAKVVSALSPNWPQLLRLDNKNSATNIIKSLNRVSRSSVQLGVATEEHAFIPLSASIFSSRVLPRSITTKVNGSFQITNWASFPYKSILVPVRTSDGFFRFV